MFSGSLGPEDDVTYIRDVALLPGERITHVFSPDQGLTGEPPVAGRVLVTTNWRILAFCRDDGRDETFLVPVEELTVVAVKSGARRPRSLLQGLLFTIGGIFLYLVIAYWLTGRFDGPSIPVINMDLGPFMVLVVAMLGVLFIGRYYFAREDGAATFQGSNWNFVFPYRGDRAGLEIYQVVNALFASRRSHDGYPSLWKD